MKLGKYNLLMMIGSCLLPISHSAWADTITTWNFNNLSVAANLTPTTSSGAGSASDLGMTFNGSTDSSDIVVGANGTNEWRVRGNNGWSNSAPQYSQGAQFLTSTVGYSNIVFSYDWFVTNTGARDLQAQYTTDGSNWTNIGALQVATANAYKTNLTIDFSTLTSVNNNANFAIRLVSAYDPTYASSNAYTQAATPTSPITTSGNWRFDNIAFNGILISAIPETDTYAMLLAGLGIMGIIARRRSAI